MNSASFRKEVKKKMEEVVVWDWDDVDFEEKVIERVSFLRISSPVRRAGSSRAIIFGPARIARR